MNGNWQFWANTGPAVQPAVVTGGQWPGITHVTLTTTAAAGGQPPVVMYYGNDPSGNRYAAMTSTTATAQATWGIQYIARADGGEEVTARGLTWRVRALTTGELTGGDAE